MHCRSVIDWPHTRVKSAVRNWRDLDGPMSASFTATNELEPVPPERAQTATTIGIQAECAFVPLARVCDSGLYYIDMMTS